MNKDEDVDVEQVILRSDNDCKRAGNLYKKLNLFESVVISLEVKGFKTRNFIKAPKYKKVAPEWFPECLDFVESDTTSEFIDTLPGFRNRRRLTAAPEKMIGDVLAGFTLADYGNAVAEALKTNKTSWVLLNLAAFYHRMNGDAYFGLECAKRAFHYSPKEHKDIALISMASLLYRGNHAEDALTIARATPNICGDNSMAPAVYTLTGLILASISDFDAAVDAFSAAIKHTKQPEVLHSYRYAIKCHAKVQIRHAL
ncbi:hypothetical protein RvY_09093 [Ramazzottius varieornatus]|uniref:Tetratricopeptide repeat protein 17 n=1 Tax=Ramazzottius varieornatus TaxID=947166 RepID=A0A1D1VDQ0_RAMVA|nr:hypothetical protein RvY_09093 [Ramazzottius varieornatus]